MRVVLVRAAMILAMYPERWKRVSKKVDPATGMLTVLVTRKRDNCPFDRVTTWKLVLHPNGWYSEGQFISTGKYRRFPEARGVKLTDSRTDRMLANLANQP